MDCWGADGNDTIDPYPLIPTEAEKILCVTVNIFKVIEKDYRTFCQLGQPAKRSFNIRPNKTNSLKKQPLKPIKEHFLDYEPSNAIYTNTSEYRRWCRVKEWFNQFGPDANNLTRTGDLIKMDT